jgi:REP element-mobilizing transposase RayT
MLYSRHTEEGFTLTMIFAGNMPLRVIRRQSDRLMEALIAVPEKAAETAPITLPEQTAEAQLPEAQAVQIAIAPPPPEVVGPLSAYSYVWLLRDPDDRLSDAAMSAIRDQLRAQLVGLGWQVATLEVHEDYVYLLADVPAEPPPNEIIQDLKRRSAQIAAQTAPRAAGSLDPETLWADSYMVLTPGRELKIEEIQRFINFAR